MNFSKPQTLIMAIEGVESANNKLLPSITIGDNSDQQGCRVEGQVILNGKNIYDPDMDVVVIRQRIGMSFQRPNPFPMSVFDSVAYGPRLYGIRNKRILEEIVERCLRHAAVWDDVKDKLYQSRLALSGGRHHRTDLH